MVPCQTYVFILLEAAPTDSLAREHIPYLVTAGRTDGKSKSFGLSWSGVEAFGLQPNAKKLNLKQNRMNEHNFFRHQLFLAFLFKK